MDLFDITIRLGVSRSNSVRNKCVGFFSIFKALSVTLKAGINKIKLLSSLYANPLCCLDIYSRLQAKVHVLTTGYTKKPERKGTAQGSLWRFSVSSASIDQYLQCLLVS